MHFFEQVKSNVSMLPVICAAGDDGVPKGHVAGRGNLVEQVEGVIEVAESGGSGEEGCPGICVGVLDFGEEASDGGEVMVGLGVEGEE